VCRFKVKAPQQQLSLQLDEQSTDSKPECPEYGMYNVTVHYSDPIVATIEINKSKLQMEIDTGASRSIIGEDTFKQLWPEALQPTITPTKVKLRTYTGAGPSLIGHDWLHELKLDRSTIHSVQSENKLQSLLQQYSMMRLENSKE